MKRGTLALALSALTALITMSSPAQAAPQIDPTYKVTLISRYNLGDYLTATYSFRYLNQGDANLTRNNWEILFEARQDFQDYFRVNTVTDDNSVIYDLGQRSCPAYEPEIFSAQASLAAKLLLSGEIVNGGRGIDLSKATPQETALVKEGHCYLTVNNDSDGRVASLFRVKKHIEDVGIEIDQISVLEGLRAQPPR